jgi:hypothetical protein
MTAATAYTQHHHNTYSWCSARTGSYKVIFPSVINVVINVNAFLIHTKPHSEGQGIPTSLTESFQYKVLAAPCTSPESQEKSLEFTVTVAGVIQASSLWICD